MNLLLDETACPRTTDLASGARYGAPDPRDLSLCMPISWWRSSLNLCWRTIQSGGCHSSDRCLAFLYLPVLHFQSGLRRPLSTAGRPALWSGRRPS